MPALEVLREPYSKQLKRHQPKKLWFHSDGWASLWGALPSSEDWDLPVLTNLELHSAEACAEWPHLQQIKNTKLELTFWKYAHLCGKTWKNKANDNCILEEKLPPAMRNRALRMGTRKDTMILQTFHLPPWMHRAQMFIFVSLLTFCRQETNYKK